MGVLRVYSGENSYDIRDRFNPNPADPPPLLPADLIAIPFSTDYYWDSVAFSSIKFFYKRVCVLYQCTIRTYVYIKFTRCCSSWAPTWWWRWTGSTWTGPASRPSQGYSTNMFHFKGPMSRYLNFKHSVSFSESDLALWFFKKKG